MSNYNGLGFSFTGVDSGLTKLQKQVQKGFESIGQTMSSLQANNAQMAKSFESSVQRSNMVADKLSTTIDSLGKSMQNLGSHAEDNLKDKVVDSMGAGSKAVQKDGDRVVKTQDEMAKGFGRIGDAVNLLKKILTQSRFQTLIQSMGLQKLQGVADQLSGGFKGALNLTTGLEGQMVSMGKSARAMGANFGFAGAELQEFESTVTSVAEAQNIDPNTVGLAVRAYKEANAEMKALGFTSATQVAKFTDAYGVSADTIRNQSMRMTRELGLQDEQMQRIYSSTVAFGQASGDVKSALESMPQLLDTIAQRRAMGESAEAATKFAVETEALAAVFFNAGQDSDKARESALQLAQTMTDAKDEFHAMVVGAGANELPGMFKELAVAGVDVNEVFATMKQGPLEFASGIDMMVRKAGGWEKLQANNSELAERFRIQLGKSFGDPKLGNQFIAAMQQGGKSIEEIAGPILNAKKDLGKLGEEAHRTGRTLEDRLNRATEHMLKNFRQISRSDARAFVSQTEKEYKKFGVTLENIASEGGALGTFVKKMSEAHQLGALAFVPAEMRGFAMVAGEAAQATLPVAAQLSALGVPVSKLLTPMGALTAGAGGLALAFRSAEKDFSGTVDALAKSDKVMKREKKAMDELSDRLGGLQEGTKEYNNVKEALDRKRFQMEQASLLKSAKTEEEAEKIRAAVRARARADTRESIQGMAKTATEQVVAFVGALPDMITGIADTLKNSASSGVLGDVFAGLGDIAIAAFDGLKAVLPLAGKALMTFVGSVWDTLQAVDWGGAINTVINVSRNVLNKAFDTLSSINWSGVFDTVFGALKSAATTIIGVLSAVDWGSVASTLADFVGGAFNTAWNILSSINWSGAISTVVEITTGIFYKAFDYIANIDWQGAFTTLFDTFANAIGALASGSGGESMIGKFGELLYVVVTGAFKAAGSILKGAVLAWWDNLTTIFDDDSGEGMGQRIGRGVLAGFTAVFVLSGAFRKKFIGMFTSIVPKLFSPIKTAIDALRHPFDTLAKFFGGRLRQEVAGATGATPVGPAGGVGTAGAAGLSKAAGPSSRMGRLKEGFKKHAGKAAIAGGLAMSMLPTDGLGSAVGDIMLYGGMAQQAASAFGLTGQSLAGAAGKLKMFGSVAGKALPIVGALAAGAVAVNEAGKRISDGWDEANGAVETFDLVGRAATVGTIHGLTSGFTGVVSVGADLLDTLGLTTDAAGEYAKMVEVTSHEVDRLFGFESEMDKARKARLEALDEQREKLGELGQAYVQLALDAHGVKAMLEDGVVTAQESFNFGQAVSQMNDYQKVLDRVHTKRLKGQGRGEEAEALAEEEVQTLVRNALTRGEINEQQAESLLQIKDYNALASIGETQWVEIARQIQLAKDGTSSMPATAEELVDLRNSDLKAYKALVAEARLLARTESEIAEGKKEQQSLDMKALEASQARQEVLSSSIATLEKTLQDPSVKGDTREKAIKALQMRRKELTEEMSSYGDLIDKMNTEGTMDKDTVNNLRAAADAFAKSELVGESSAKNIDMLVAASQSMSSGDMIADLEKMMASGGGFGRAMRDGLIPSEAEIQEAMQMVDQSAQKDLEKLRQRLAQERTDYQAALQASTNEALVNLQGMGFNVAEETARGLVENKDLITSAWTEATSGLTLGGGTQGGVESLLGFGESSSWLVNKSTEGQRNSFRADSEALGLAGALQKNREYLETLQQLYKENPVEVSTKLGVEPITSEDFLAAYSQATDEETKQKLKERLGITALIDPEEAAKIQQALSSVPGQVTEEQTAQMQEAAQNLQTFFTDATETSKGAIQSVMDKAEEVHGNSVNTVVIEDFQKATAGILTEADNIRMVFDSMSTDVERIFSEMWLSILDQTDIAANAIYDDASLVLNQMRTVQAQAETTVDADAIPTKKLEFDSTDASVDLVTATHMPQWYTDHYHKQVEEMKKLLGVIASNSSGLGAGGGSGRPGRARGVIKNNTSRGNSSNSPIGGA